MSSWSNDIGVYRVVANNLHHGSFFEAKGQAPQLVSLRGSPEPAEPADATRPSLGGLFYSKAYLNLTQNPKGT